MIKGEIWWASLPSPRGSEPEKTRPVVVIQGDSFNRISISTVVCAVITSNISLASAPGNLLLEKADSGLGKSSVINFSQILTLDKACLTQMISMLSKPQIQKINTNQKSDIRYQLKHATRYPHRRTVFGGSSISILPYKAATMMPATSPEPVLPGRLNHIFGPEAGRQFNRRHNGCGIALSPVVLT
jgi:mRNA interferase MazF